MRILLAAFGSRGDVQPLLALGKGLQSAGYTVIVAAGRNFQSWVESCGLLFEPFGVDVDQVITSDVGKQWLSRSSHNPMREIANMRRMVHSASDSVVVDLLRMADRADVFVSGFLTVGPLDVLARARGKGHLVAWLTPVVPTRIGAAGMQAPLPTRSSVVNRWFGYVIEAMLWTMFAAPVHKLCRALGLPLMTRAEYIRAINRTPSVCGFSRHVVPPPLDWPADHHLTGYWRDPLPPDWQPPAVLRDFLAAGQPPVYIGFGSMTTFDPEATMRLIVEALRLSGQRGVIHRGMAGLRAEDLPPAVQVVDHVPHGWLLPRMAAVVHHGGAGTTAAALMAGVPSLIVAHMGDQPFWGRRVHELGVGAQPLRRHELTAELLAARIREMITDQAMRQRAAALGHTLSAEDGVANAVVVIGRLAEAHQTHRPA